MGSILHHLPPDYDGYVLGAGKLYDWYQPQLQDAHVLALRGPLTAAGYKGHPVLADPGILAPDLVTVETKLWSTGVIPHLTDTRLETMREFTSAPDSVVIHPWRDPLWVVRTIGECRRIVTSSLHGLIVADAFGIPRRFVYSPTLDSPHEGGRFKFDDYSASIGLPLEVGTFQLASRDRISDMRDLLFDVFEQFGEEMGNNG